MGARVIKVLKMAVGQYEVEGSDKPRSEWREVGVEIECDDGKGNTWTELKLHADMLNPVLFALVRALMPKLSSSVWVKKFDVTRRVKDPTADDSGPPEDEESRPF